MVRMVLNKPASFRFFTSFWIHSNRFAINASLVKDA
jgi:hypothetical protein